MTARQRVLVVEDDPSLLRWMADCLTAEQLEVTAVESGVEALALLHEHDFDLILSEMRLPTMSGLDLMERAQALRADQVLLLISGFATVDMVLDAVRRGEAHYLPKPFTPPQLVAGAFSALAHRRALFENRALRGETGRGHVGTPAHRETSAFSSFSSPSDGIRLGPQGLALSAVVDDLERSLILQSLELSAWDSRKAAAMLRLEPDAFESKRKRLVGERS